MSLLADLTTMHLLILGEFLSTDIDKINIAAFDYKKAIGYCKIKADYIIRDRISDDIYFVFLKSREEEYFCISAFKEESRDYFLNQQKMTVLYKAKTIDSVKTELFKHQRYDLGAIGGELALR